VVLNTDAANHLVDVAGGDARSLLNALELAVESSEPATNGTISISLTTAEESIQQRAVLYDKQGDAHYDTISAFIKSLRGSDADAALFWLARMVEAGENPRFIFRRMLIAAGEDIGLADPQAMVVVEACAAAFERVGLPEGLYPLAQAALYLAGTEKSNSILGFFDALKSVRDANRQDVPLHLRDANRDGDAFGDGVGYRYPHAYADHWVEQQYLPTALQGEVFWQPGALGWEGQRRERMGARRAAQLAAAAELAADQPLLLSSGPDSPGLERWIQRQLGQEGERLHQLRERLWGGVSWQRHDRVLILGARSLIWALDPLRAVPEGGVTILCSSSDDRHRIEAQIQLLDPELRPQLLSGGLEELQESQAFEWIGGRLSTRDLQLMDWSLLGAGLRTCCHPKTQLRLLLTQAEAGPATALHASNPKEIGIKRLMQQEQNWMDAQSFPQQELETQGWWITRESWLEILTLQGGNVLAERWLSESSDYRQAMGPIDTATLTALRQRLEFLKVDGLRLPMRHHLLLGQQKE
jgi:putative ATPase